MPRLCLVTYIEDACETDMYSDHLDMMFSESSPPLPWNNEHAYTCEAVELYYEAGTVFPLSKTEILRYLLEGTPGSLAENLCDEEKGASESSNHCFPTGSLKWVKVNEKKTLYDVLRHQTMLSLESQYSMLFPNAPASTKNSKLGIGLHHHEFVADKHKQDFLHFLG